MVSRDLEGARKAYLEKDEDLSRRAHIIKQEEGHKPQVSGAAGAEMSISTILILGFAGAFADGLSMGIGDALSAKAETEHFFQERAREFWELQHDQPGENRQKKKMVNLYVKRGMSRQDAELVVNIMAQHRAFFVDIITMEHLGLVIPGEDDNPWKDGFVTFTSFVIFGSVPLLGFCFFPVMFPNISSRSLFIVACILTVCTLFVLGAIKGAFSQKKYLRSGLEMTIVGVFVAILAYVIGNLTQLWVGVRAPTYSSDMRSRFFFFSYLLCFVVNLKYKNNI